MFSLGIMQFSDQLYGKNTIFHEYRLVKVGEQVPDRV